MSDTDDLKARDDLRKSLMDAWFRRDELQQALSERNRIIALAPHAPGCSWYWTATGLSCNCWKSGAPGAQRVTRGAGVWDEGRRVFNA